MDMENHTTNPTTYFTIEPTDIQHSLPLKHLFIGCGLAIGGNILISVSLNLQKYTHMKNQATEDAGENAKHYLRSPVWWLGIILMALGELGNFSAYGFAPASLVAPLGTTTVVANMFIAVIFLKEKLRPEDLFGCTLAVVGAFLLVNFAQKDETIADAETVVSFLLQTSFIIYTVVELGALVILMIMKYRLNVNNVLVLLLITSLLASFTVISAKAASGMLQLTLEGKMQLDKPVLYVMLLILAVTCVAQVKYLNEAMMGYNSTVVVPTNFVFFTISAIVAGIVFYREFWGMSALSIFMFLFGCLLCFLGVYFITAGRTNADESEEQRERSTLQRMADQFCPSWLFNSTEKTPPLQDDSTTPSDQTPIITSEAYLPTSSSSSEVNHVEEPMNGGKTNYGATVAAPQ